MLYGVKLFYSFRWGQLGDVLVLPTTSFKDPIWDSIGDKLWPSVARSLGTCRLARQLDFEAIRTQVLNTVLLPNLGEAYALIEKHERRMKLTSKVIVVCDVSLLADQMSFAANSRSQLHPELQPKKEYGKFGENKPHTIAISEVS
ncbi:hypothetical protein GIB67_011506 [Kingdonia uniflora]|uniref:Uncharacterized protein n=1 Tax=Kingdonia uniflora TaxID=39325 RepID=A0A7J7NLL3_9MAGN|nr:hypothetical protein GIB67_011506 [Kingdonia uniflora]